MRFPSVLTMSGSSTPASCTFVVECSGGAPDDSTVVPDESAARPCLGTVVVRSAAPAPSVMVTTPPRARSIRYSGAWSLKYWSTVSQLLNGFNTPANANAVAPPPDGVPGSPPRGTATPTPRLRTAAAARGLG